MAQTPYRARITLLPGAQFPCILNVVLNMQGQEALRAHEYGLYSCVRPTLFTQIERVIGTSPERHCTKDSIPFDVQVF